MKYNVYTANGKLIDKGLSSSDLEEQYDIKQPDRLARKGLIAKRMYVLEQVEE